MRAWSLVVSVTFLVCLGAASDSKLRLDVSNCASSGNIQTCAEMQHVGLVEKIAIPPRNAELLMEPLHQLCIGFAQAQRAPAGLK